MTNALLALIVILLIVVIIAMKQQTKSIIAMLDAFAEMAGDLMRELIKKTEGEK